MSRDTDNAASRFRTDGAAVECPKCHAKFGGMTVCPWDGSTLVLLADADPTAVAFYDALVESEGRDWPEFEERMTGDFERGLADV